MQDVADLAKVHRTTVSLVLRRHPRIPEATREKVLKAVEALSYRPNPLISALMKARRNRHSSADLSTIAWVTAWPTRYGWRAPENPIPDFMPGASRRAAELGYKLDHFWLNEPGMSPSRFSKILSARGITGVVLGRLPPGLRQIDLAWEHFSSVSIGVSLESPRLSHVAENHFHSCKLAVQTCLSRGYSRLGLVLPHRLYERVQEKFLGAFLSETHALEAKRRIPPLISDTPDERLFDAWFARHKPDLIVCPNISVVHPWIQRLGLDAPGDVGIVGLAVEKLDGSHAGIWSDPAIIGSMAVELVVATLNINERGVPKHPQEILYTPQWIEGRTLRPQEPGRSAQRQKAEPGKGRDRPADGDPDERGSRSGGSQDSFQQGVLSESGRANVPHDGKAQRTSSLLRKADPAGGKGPGAARPKLA